MPGPSVLGAPRHAGHCDCLSPPRTQVRKTSHTHTETFPLGVYTQPSIVTSCPKTWWPAKVSLLNDACTRTYWRLRVRACRPHVALMYLRRGAAVHRQPTMDGLEAQVPACQRPSQLKRRGCLWRHLHRPSAAALCTPEPAGLALVGACRYDKAQKEAARHHQKAKAKAKGGIAVLTCSV